MAYAIKYLFKFESSNGTTREIRVLQDGYTGEVIQRPLGRAPVLKKQQNGPVHGTSLEFYAECNVDREFIEFYTSDPKAYRVDLYAGATLLWQGYITPELYREPDIAPPYDVQVVVTDGVGELKLYNYAAQGTVTLRALLSGLLARTGLGTDVYLISSLKAGSRGAGALLDMTINLDYMAGKTCYETLTYILNTLHATITWWKGAWILTRETNVTFTSGKVRYFNTSGNSALLADSVQTLGSLRANPAWPVGQLSTVIDPAKNRVTVQAPWHVVTGLQNSDMTSDASWAKSNNASYGPDGYLFPNNDEGTSTYATAYISQALAMEGLRVPMSFELRATGVSAQVGVRVGAVIGVLLTYTVGNVVYHLRKGSEGTPEWTPGPTIGTTIDGSLVDYQRPLASFDMDRIQAENLQITDIPAFVQGTSYPSGTLTVYILGTCARVYAATLDVVLPKGYQDILRIDNGARGEGSEVEIAIGRETAENAYYAAFLQGLLLDSGDLITSFSDANFPGGMDYLAFIARDYALSVALPRAKVTGTVYLESGIAAPPLVFTKGALNYWLQTWSWNLYEDELEIEGLTLPSASLTVESETILESTAGASSSSGRTSGGGGSIAPGVSMAAVQEWVNGQGFATETWVTDKGYLTGITDDMIADALGYTPLAPDDLLGYATQSWVTSQGYLTEITDQDVRDALGYTPVSPTDLTTALGGYVKKTGDTMSGNLTINGLSNGDNVAPLMINDAYESATWARFIQALYPNIPVGGIPNLFFGKDATTRNGGVLAFYYAGSGSTSNLLTLGLHSVDHVLSVSGGGNVAVGYGTTPAAYKFDVNGAARVTSLRIGATTNAAASLLEWDETNRAWKLTGNFYATGWMSAGGVSSGGGASGIDLAAMWASLTNSISDAYAATKIAAAHIPDMSGTYGYLKSADAVANVTLNGDYLRVTKGGAVNDLTIPYATRSRYVVGDNNAASPQYALLQSGAGRQDASPSGDTWLFYDTLGGTSTPWGIRHNQADNTIGFIGGGTERILLNMQTGAITGVTFVKSGGTSSQFLKADGSVDSSAYITGITSGMVTNALGYTPYYSGNFVEGTNYQAPIGDLATIRSNASNGNAAYNALGNYLPLTGGTLSANSPNLLKINSTHSTGNNYAYFSVSGTNKASVGYYSGLAFVANEATYARIGVNDAGTPQYWSNATATTAQTLLHTGNYSTFLSSVYHPYGGSTSVAFSASRVGIGTSYSTIYPLYVNQSSTSLGDVVYLNSASTWASIIYKCPSSITWSVGANGTGFFFWNSQKSGDAVHITNDGNLYIYGLSDGNNVAPMSITDNYAATTWTNPIKIFYPNIAAGAIPNIYFGKDASARNGGYVGFYYAGSSSTSNLLTFGLHSQDHVLTVSGGGNVAIGKGTTPASYKLDVNGSIHAALGSSISVGTPGGGAASNIASYISAGPGYSPSSGRYGLKIVVCDQLDAASGLGQDLVTPTGWTSQNGYNLCVAGGNSSSDYGYISFVSHKVNSTSYRYLGGFYDNAGTIQFQVRGNILATGAITAGSASDARLKTNIRALSADAAKRIVMGLNPVTFTWNAEATKLYDRYKGDDLGMIAQEVEPYLPQAIGTIFEKYKRLDYDKVVTPLVKVAQDHETRLAQAEGRIAALERENAELKRKIFAC